MGVDSLIDIIRRTNQELGKDAYMDWFFHRVNGKRLMKILTIVNIYGEPSLSKA
ncbi:hypothetical protein GF352_03125 [archaeon]|nr:hypothetical protein [archaeon]